MRLADALTALGLARYVDALLSGVESTVGRAMDPSGYLSAGYVRRACDRLRMKSATLRSFLSALPAMTNSEALMNLFYHCRWVIFESDFASRELLSKWPSPLDPEGSRLPDMFYAFVFLSGLDLVERQHLRHRVPEDVTIDTLSDLELWIEDYRAREGRPGLAAAHWLFCHFTGRLYKLGRLQFLMTQFPFDLEVWRNTGSGDVVCLAPDGAEFRSDGQFNGATGYRVKAPFRAELSEDESGITGNPIDVLGCVRRTKVRIEKSRWRRVLQSGDNALNFHIPATGSMDYGACRNAFLRATEFFGERFKGFSPTCFYSVSWLYDNQLEHFLDPRTNIMRLQRGLHLFPVPEADDKQLFDRLIPGYHAHHGPRECSPCGRSTLEQVASEFAARGGLWHHAGALLFADDFTWGVEPYRRRSDLRGRIAPLSVKGLLHGVPSFVAVAGRAS